MKTVTLSLIALTALLLLNAPAQEEPKRPPSKPKASTKKKQAAKDEDEEAKPKKSADKPTAKGDEATPTDGPKKQAHPPAVSSIATDELAGFDGYPEQLKSVIGEALALTRLNLAYTFGGSAPTEGGMDCSGTIYYLLTKHGMKEVPRSSDEICEWVREHSGMHLAPDGVELSHDAFSALRPGDLLFWTGTYETLPRKLPVSHIMMYLGTLKSNGKPVVFGASDGRYYAGERRSGVSVFDFSMPRAGSKAAFYGYGTIPGMAKAKSQDEVRRALPPPGKKLDVAAAHEDAAPKTKAKDDDDAPTPKKKAPSEEKPVAKADDEAPKKLPTPHKSSTPKKKASSGSAAKKKAASDDIDPGAAVRKAVDSIRKVFN